MQKILTNVFKIIYNLFYQGAKKNIKIESLKNRTFNSCKVYTVKKGHQNHKI